MEFQNHPVATAELLIRKPVAEGFEAFVDPALITTSWFDKSSGPPGSVRTVLWHRELISAIGEGRVKAIEVNQRILIDRGNGDAPTLEWTLYPRSADTSQLSVVNSGFAGHGDEIVRQALELPAATA